MPNRQSSIVNRQSDDELISAYVDGQLAGDALAAFEARLRVEPALKQRVDVTRLLVSTARALPAQPLPRNFTVPVPARPRSQATSFTWFLRLGSALATAVFVIAVGIDLAGLTAPRPATQSAFVLATQPADEAEAGAAQAPAETPAPQGSPQAKQERAAAPAEAQTETLMATSDITESADLTFTVPYDIAPTETPTIEMQSMAVAAAPAEEAVSATPQPTQAPSGMGGGGETGAATAQAETTSTPEPMDAARSANTVTEEQPAEQPVEPPAVAPDTQQLPEAPAAPLPEVQAVPPSAQAPAAEPASAPWLRIVAGAAFILAIALGVLGWRRT